MMKLLELLFFLMIVNKMGAQNDPYYFSDSIISQYGKDSQNETAAVKFSFIGEYIKALEYWDKKANHIADYQAIKNKYIPVSAIEFIEKKAETEQIIIINEAHHQPSHRVFTTKLLQRLYNQGFRYFSAETLLENDIARLNLTKTPTVSTGYYTNEPCYGNLIREALRIGFKVFAYEATNSIPGQVGIQRREEEQAKNIKKIIDADPKAKILIHCGFGHLTEWCELPDLKLMGCLVKEYTGINPYTIDQISNTERFLKEKETPFYKETDIVDNMVFIDSNNHELSVKNLYDVAVFLPRTKYIEGRPNWMFSFERIPYIIDSRSHSYPILIYAYLEDEYVDNTNQKNKAIPFDLIEIKSEKETKALSLQRGNYIIIIKDTSGKEEFQKIAIK